MKLIIKTNICLTFTMDILNEKEEFTFLGITQLNFQRTKNPNDFFKVRGTYSS